MLKKKKEEMYFYRAEGYEERVINGGEKVYRDATMAAGTWKPLPCSIDRLLEHIHLFTGCHTHRNTLLTALHICDESVTRVRRNGAPLPDRWLVNMANYTGLSLPELYAIAGLKPRVGRFDANRPKFALAA